jgi:hypothetical protein
MADFWNDLAPEVRERIELGNDSANRLRRGEHVEWWVNVGRAVRQMQIEAMRYAGTNVNKGRRYNEAWAELAKHAPSIVSFHKNDRQHAAWLADNWEAVNAWLHSLGERERMKKNHPQAIHRSYDAAHAVRHPDAETAAVVPKRSAAQQIETLDIIRMLRSGTFRPGTSMSEVADALHAGLAYDALRRLHLEIGRRLANEDRQDRIEGEVQARGEARVKVKTASKSAPRSR